MMFDLFKVLNDYLKIIKNLPALLLPAACEALLSVLALILQNLILTNFETVFFMTLFAKICDK
jgi:hypothetical protein